MDVLAYLMILPALALIISFYDRSRYNKILKNFMLIWQVFVFLALVMMLSRTIFRFVGSDDAYAYAVIFVMNYVWVGYRLGKPLVTERKCTKCGLLSLDGKQNCLRCYGFVDERTVELPFF